MANNIDSIHKDVGVLRVYVPIDKLDYYDRLILFANALLDAAEALLSNPAYADATSSHSAEQWRELRGVVKDIRGNGE